MVRDPCVAAVLCDVRLMSLPEVLRLPEVVVEEESKLMGESCPVCLETYQVGDKVSYFEGACS